MTTTSSSLTFTNLCSCAAMSDSALIGSPCDPVQMMQTSPGAYVAVVLDVDDAVGGQRRAGPSRGRARCSAIIDRPRNATRRPGVDRLDRDLLHPVQVRREARDDDAAVGVVAQEVADHRTDGRLRRREARPLGVGGVGQQQLHALAADLAEAGEVGACGRRPG